MIPFVILALTNCWVVFWNKKSFGISLPATLTGTVLLAYFSQLLFHTFNIGIYVCIAVAVCAVILFHGVFRKVFLYFWPFACFSL